jgi:hypothetical protein
LDQEIDVQVDITQRLTIKDRGNVNVAIVTLKAAIRGSKPKNIEPAIEPVVFRAERAAGDLSNQVMNDLSVEPGIENQ